MRECDRRGKGLAWDRLQVAARVSCTEVEGPGRRFAVWVQGCSIRCPGCCNPHMFDPAGGASVEVDTLAKELCEAQRARAIEGVTVVGGEPLEQLRGVSELADRATQLGLGVLVFTGLRWSEARRVRGFDRLWARIDTLIAGRFVATQSKTATIRRFVGSSNQTLHHRTDRYADPALWTGDQRAEVQISPRGEVTVVGMPGLGDEVDRALLDGRL